MAKPYLLDKRDIKIIQNISDNARLSYSQLGKLTKISKDRVRERLVNLQKELFILSYFPLIEYEKLGYKRFHLFIRFNRLNDANKFSRILMHFNNLVAFTWLAGRYDYEIQLLAKSKREVRMQLQKFVPLLNKLNHTLVLPSDIVYYTMHVWKRGESGFWDYEKGKIKKEKIDNRDLAVLHLLSKNGRLKIIDMAEKMRISPDVVRYRIKSLSYKGIIKGFYARVNKHRLGLNSYILFVKLKKDSEKILREISRLPNVYYISRSKKPLTAFLNFYALDNKELISTLNKIRIIAGSDFLDFELNILLDRYFFNTFPDILLKKQ